MLTLFAPAKINLTLEVLGRRPDRFHEIRSVIQTLSFGDTLRFRESNRLHITSNLPGWLPEKSLIMRTVELMRDMTGMTAGAEIDVTKRIPLSSGLGGDSSAAAATLSGLNALWGLNLPREKLYDLAAQVGSDVPFFLHGGTALIEGRGEIVTPLPPLPRRCVVLVMPGIPQIAEKTKRLYSSLKPAHYSGGQMTEQLVKRLRNGETFHASSFHNVFEKVADDVFPGLKHFRNKMAAAGAEAIHLAGSGPALFTMLKEKRDAHALCDRLTEAGLQAYLAETLKSPEVLES